MTYFIPVNEPLIGEREKELVMECLSTGWISSEGPFVSRFEELFSRRVHRQYGIACANGSAALDIAIAALKLGPGDEVILPSFTIISCASAIVRAGATPVVVDCDPDTWNMVPELVASAITSRTAAIMVVHIYGLPVDMDSILDMADRHGLAVIEDAAELIGATYKGKPCGSFGHLSTFSFYPNKHITTGEGGMVVTNDEQLAQRCRSLRNLCFQPNKRFVHEELGWNYRMTNLQAALGIAQLEKLGKSLARKESIGLLYDSLLQNTPSLKLPIISTPYANNCFWVYGVVLSETLGIDANYLMQKLGEVSVGTRPFFCPMHLQPVFHSLYAGSIPSLKVSEHLYRYGFYLPSGLAIKDADVIEVVRRLKSVLDNLTQ